MGHFATQSWKCKELKLSSNNSHSIVQILWFIFIPHPRSSSSKNFVYTMTSISLVYPRLWWKISIFWITARIQYLHNSYQNLKIEYCQFYFTVSDYSVLVNLYFSIVCVPWSRISNDIMRCKGVMCIHIIFVAGEYD